MVRTNNSFNKNFGVEIPKENFHSMTSGQYQDGS